MQHGMVHHGSTAMAAGPFSHQFYTLKRPLFSLLSRSFKIFDPAGNLVLYVKVPFRLKEEWNIYADEAMSQPLVCIKARSMLSLKMPYDVIDLTTGQSIGILRSQGLKSIFRDEWDVLDPHEQEIGSLKEEGSSFLRRLIPLLLGEWSMTIRGQQVGYLKQVFRWFTKEFTLDVSTGQGHADTRFVVAGAMLALMREIVRESQ